VTFCAVVLSPATLNLIFLVFLSYETSSASTLISLLSKHVEKELVVKISVPSTPKGRVEKRAAAVRARMPVVERMLVCICRRNAF